MLRHHSNQGNIDATFLTPLFVISAEIKSLLQNNNSILHSFLKQSWSTSSLMEELPSKRDGDARRLAWGFILSLGCKFRSHLGCLGRTIFAHTGID